MRRLAAAFSITCAALALSPSAQAGVFSDDLSRCLVTSSSPQDQIVLIRWLYGAMSSHPAVKAYSSITEEQKDMNTKAVAGLFTRLLTVDCKQQTVLAVQNEGPAAFQQSFSALGQSAMMSFAKDPSFAAATAKISKELDLKKFQDLVTK